MKDYNFTRLEKARNRVKHTSQVLAEAEQKLAFWSQQVEGLRAFLTEEQAELEALEQEAKK